MSTSWSPPKKEDQEPLGTSSASLVPEPLRKKQAVAMCAFESAWTKLADETGGDPIALHNVGAGTVPLQDAMGAVPMLAKPRLLIKSCLAMPLPAPWP